MRRRRLLVVSFGLIVLLVGLGLVWQIQAWLAGPISPAGYRKIRLGMTLREVTFAIGLQPGNYDTKHRRYGSMSGPFGTCIREMGIPEKTLPNAAPSLNSEPAMTIRMQIWSGSDYWIWVAFDENGKAVGYYLFESGGGHVIPTFERLRSWIGY